MIFKDCRDCGHSLELTPKQINFQRLVRARRGYVLCDVCDVKALEKKWVNHIVLAASITKQDSQVLTRQQIVTAKTVRKVLHRNR